MLKNIREYSCKYVYSVYVKQLFLFLLFFHIWKLQFLLHYIIY